MPPWKCVSTYGPHKDFTYDSIVSPQIVHYGPALAVWSARLPVLDGEGDGPNYGGSFSSRGGEMVMGVNEEQSITVCPPEEEVERWAMQTVLDQDADEWKAHLILCGPCSRLHQHFVEFYSDLARSARNCLSPIRIKGAPAPYSERGEIKRVVQMMRTLAPVERALNCRAPVAFSQALVTNQRAAGSSDLPFVSSDGIVIGKLLRPVDGLDSCLQLVSPDHRFVRRALIRLPDSNYLYQSDDSGAVSLLTSAQIAQEARIMEIVPFAVEAAYSNYCRGQTTVIPASEELDGGVLGRIAVEQEEGDHNEAVLHVAFPELPPELREARLFVALADDIRPASVDEAVGRDVYFYGRDLFTNFRLWAYLR